MKNFIKKLVCLVMAAALLLSLTGCSDAKSAERAVNKLFSSIESLDVEGMQKQLLSSDADLSALSEALGGDTGLYMKLLLKKASHEIISSEQVDENTVNVHVRFTTPPIVSVFGAFAAKSAKYSLSIMFDEPQPSEKEIAREKEAIFKEILKDVIDNKLKK